MPISVVPAAVALERRKSPLAGWGSRSEANRLEPIATPGFPVPFFMEPGEAIFTIGSCFARNVEDALERRGFAIPARDLFKTPEFADLPWRVLNNYGVPSIANEIGWALDPGTPFDDERNFVEVAPDRHYDLHLTLDQTPGTLAEVRRRRRALIAAMARARDCRVVVMTLGLSELWFDTEQGLYLNTIPNLRVLRIHPNRFELHVLGYEDCKEHIDRALDTLAAFSRADQQVLLTVSPVPMATTFRDADVIVANCFSKSCLRTVAEAASCERGNVHYFPSYESVTLSDRKLAWMADFIHPTRDIVDLNVGRMVRAFVPAGAGTEPAEPEGLLAAIETARSLAGDRSPATARFFERHAALAQESPTFALHLAQFHLLHGDARRATEALALVPPDHDPVARAVAAAQCASLDGDHDRAAAALLPLRGRGLLPTVFWTTLFQALAGASKGEQAWLVAGEAAAAGTAAERTAFQSLGQAFVEADPGLACRAFERGLESPEAGRPMLHLSYLRALGNAGRLGEAEAHAPRVAAVDPVIAKHVTHVMATLRAAAHA